MFCTRMDMFRCVFVFLSITITYGYCDVSITQFVEQHKDRYTTVRPKPEVNFIDKRNTPDSNQLPIDEIPNEALKNTTITQPDTSLSTSTIIYIGIGVLVAVLLISQAICLYIYIRNAKATRQTIETVLRSNQPGRTDNNTVRYSKAPELNIKRSPKTESHVYEVLPELGQGTGKKPLPPPLATLPKVKKLPPPQISDSPKLFLPERIQQPASLTPSPTGSSSLRREKTVKSPPREVKPPTIRPKLPLPNEQPEKHCTLPKKYNDNSLRLNHKTQSSMSVPRNDVDKNELMAKLKQRLVLNEVKTNSFSSNVNLPNVSTPGVVVPTKPSSLGRVKRIPAPPRPLPKPHVKNDCDNSDDEWEMEQLKPVNLYNI